MDLPEQTLNIRFLLWKHAKTTRQNWAEHLANWLVCPVEKAGRILQGEKITHEQFERLARVPKIAVDEGEFFNRSLLELEEVDVLQENVKFLLEQLRYGEAKTLAVALEVSDDTVSEWRRWRRKTGIEKQHLAGLTRYFRIDQRANLSREPIFLSIEPMGIKQKRDWLHVQLKHLDEEKLDALYPALRLLLKNE